MPADTLRQLHRLHNHAEDLQNRIRRLPIQLKAQQAKVAKQEAAYQEADEAVKRLQVQCREHESALKSVEQKIEKYKRQIKEISSKKEFDALQHEIAAAREKISAIEDEILVGMEAIEEKAAELPKQEAVLNQARKERDEFEQSMESRKSDLEHQLEEALRQTTATEGELSGIVREQYDRVKNARGGSEGLAAVAEGVCSACATEITPQMEQDLIQKKFVTCKACGRILYPIE